MRRNGVADPPSRGLYFSEFVDDEAVRSSEARTAQEGLSEGGNVVFEDDEFIAPTRLSLRLEELDLDFEPDETEVPSPPVELKGGAEEPPLSSDSFSSPAPITDGSSDILASLPETPPSQREIFRGESEKSEGEGSRENPRQQEDSSIAPTVVVASPLLAESPPLPSPEGGGERPLTEETLGREGDQSALYAMKTLVVDTPVLPEEGIQKERPSGLRYPDLPYKPRASQKAEKSDREGTRGREGETTEPPPSYLHLPPDRGFGVSGVLSPLPKSSRASGQEGQRLQRDQPVDILGVRRRQSESATPPSPRRSIPGTHDEEDQELLSPSDLEDLFGKKGAAPSLGHKEEKEEGGDLRVTALYDELGLGEVASSSSEKDRSSSLSEDRLSPRTPPQPKATEPDSAPSLKKEEASGRREGEVSLETDWEGEWKAGGSAKAVDLQALLTSSVSDLPSVSSDIPAEKAKQEGRLEREESLEDLLVPRSMKSPSKPSSESSREAIASLSEEKEKSPKKASDSMVWGGVPLPSASPAKIGDLATLTADTMVDVAIPSLVSGQEGTSAGEGREGAIESLLPPSVKEEEERLSLDALQEGLSADLSSFEPMESAEDRLKDLFPEGEEGAGGALWSEEGEGGSIPTTLDWEGEKTVLLREEKEKKQEPKKTNIRIALPLLLNHAKMAKQVLVLLGKKAAIRADATLQFRKNWWIYCDILAAIIFTISSAALLSYFLWF